MCTVSVTYKTMEGRERTTILDEAVFARIMRAAAHNLQSLKAQEGEIPSIDEQALEQAWLLGYDMN